MIGQSVEMVVERLFSGDIFTGKDDPNDRNGIEVTDTGIKLTGYKKELCEAHFILANNHESIMKDWPAIKKEFTRQELYEWFKLATEYKQSNIERPLLNALKFMISNS